MVLRNVLIFHAAALGDFVLTFPLALGLARLYPQSRIIYVTHGQKGKLAEVLLGVESANIENGFHHLFSGGELPAGAQRIIEQAHLIANLAKSDQKWTARVRSIAPRAEVVTVDPRLPSKGRGHVAMHMVDQLSAWPAIQAAAAQMLQWIVHGGIHLPRPAGMDVLLHPGSGGQDKCWPIDRFLRLAEVLRENGRHTTFVLGEVEIERFSPEQIECLSATADVRRPSTYIDLMYLLQSARAFVGNDSGPSHLSGILGLPTLCLFGPTDPRIWVPLGPNVMVLRRQPLESLEVNEVVQAFNSGFGA